MHLIEDEKGIQINQELFINLLLECFNMSECKTRAFPYEPGFISREESLTLNFATPRNIVLS